MYIVEPQPTGDGREVAVIPLTFGRARIVVSEEGSACYFDGWRYDHPGVAVAALEAWRVRQYAKEPDGWMRNPQTGRRRPGGDASKEYVMW